MRKIEFKELQSVGRVAIETNVDKELPQLNTLVARLYL
jgi:hypothetical protein